MTEQSWKPLFRTPKSTVTKVLQSPAFAASRERSGALIEDPEALRDLAAQVETLDHENAPLSAISDRVEAAVRFLRAEADGLDAGSAAHLDTSASQAARRRLIVAALHYLITPVDLVPDFRVGGYIDDVLLLSWVFGAAADELEPFLAHDPAD